MTPETPNSTENFEPEVCQRVCSASTKKREMNDEEKGNNPNNGSSSESKYGYENVSRYVKREE